MVRALYNSSNKYESGAFVADYFAETLVMDGVPRERVQTVFLEAGRRDRAYSKYSRFSKASVTSGLTILISGSCVDPRLFNGSTVNFL